MLDASIAYTVWEYSEWGNPNIEAEFHCMCADAQTLLLAPR